MNRIDTDARIMGLIFGLGDLAPAPICHGYQNACVCSDCLERQRLANVSPITSPVQIRQPWDVQSRAA